MNGTVMLKRLLIIIIELCYKIYIACFQYTLHGFKLKKLRNIHKGERCFIIGNGPSLRADDLDLLSDEITFAVNRIFHIFPTTKWRPTYYCAGDPQIIIPCIKEINDINVKAKFLPINIVWNKKVSFPGALLFYFNYQKIKNNRPIFSRNIAQFIKCGGSVVYNCMQIAAYMGFKEIYLLGIDHHFPQVVDLDGNLVVDKNAKGHFSNDYLSSEQDVDIPSPQRTEFAYISAQKYADENGFKIFNATRGGKLEVFERVDFDDLFPKVTTT